MDLLESGPERKGRSRRRATALHPRAALAAALAVLLAASAVTLVRFADEAARSVVAPLRASDVPEAVVGVSDDAIRLIGSGPGGDIVSRRMRGGGQLANRTVVGIVDGIAVALSGRVVIRLGVADYWVPTRERDEAWLVRDGLAARYTVTGRQVAFRPIGGGRLRGETGEGLVVDVDGEVRILGPRGAVVRTLSTNGHALAVGGDRVVLQSSACLTCPLRIDDGTRSPLLVSTADAQQVRNPDSVRISPDGRFLAYTRLLTSGPGPLSGVAEVIVVDVEADRLRVLPRSEGADWETELIWLDHTLMFVRRLGSRLVVSVVERDLLRTGQIAVDPDIDDVVGAIAAP